jgi:hypothetical protein
VFETRRLSSAKGELNACRLYSPHLGVVPGGGEAIPRGVAVQVENLKKHILRNEDIGRRVRSSLLTLS